MINKLQEKYRGFLIYIKTGQFGETTYKIVNPRTRTHAHVFTLHKARKVVDEVHNYFGNGRCNAIQRDIKNRVLRLLGFDVA